MYHETTFCNQGRGAYDTTGVPKPPPHPRPRSLSWRHNDVCRSLFEFSILIGAQLLKALTALHHIQAESTHRLEQGAQVLQWSKPLSIDVQHKMGMVLDLQSLGLYVSGSKRGKGH